MSISLHETAMVFDSTKLQTFQRCPRKAFFRFVLGWTSELPSKHLVHGAAWHEGLAHILTSDYTKEDAAYAGILYERYYREYFHENMDVDNHPKTPGVALLAYASYVEQYAKDKEYYNTMYVEIPGSVPVDKDHLIYFKLDSIVEERKTGKILSLEHKTSSRNSVIDRAQWFLKTQIGTYTHALNCMYGTKRVKYIVINRTFFYRASPSVHDRFPIMKSKDMMDSWLWDTTHFIHLFEFELERLDGCRESDSVLKAFPRNSEACTDYMTLCPFFDVCMQCANPLQRECPDDMKVEFWDPRKKEQDSEVYIKNGKIIERCSN